MLSLAITIKGSDKFFSQCFYNSIILWKWNKTDEEELLFVAVATQFVFISEWMSCKDWSPWQPCRQNSNVNKQAVMATIFANKVETEVWKPIVSSC